MNGRYVFLLVAFLFLPTLVLADIADTDWVTDDDTDGLSQYSCADVCAKTGTCDVPCISGDCMTYCWENLTQKKINCAAFVDCEEFVECLCAAEEEGDQSDDGCGCGVSNQQSGFLLTVVMFVIGFFAVGYSLKNA